MLCNKTQLLWLQPQLSEAKSHTIHYGIICDGERVVDDVVVAVFHAPHSYTGEEDVEFADRAKLRSMLEKTDNAVVRLMESFKGADKKTNWLIALMFLLFIVGLGIIAYAGN